MRTVWRLTVEPVRTGAMWSLLQAEPGRPVEPVDGGVIRESGLAELARSLVPRLEGTGPNRQWHSPLLDPVRERLVMRSLGDALLPEMLVRALGRQRVTAPRHSVEVAARGWAGMVPWDVIMIDDSGVRLGEVARVLHALPAGVIAGRARCAPRLDPAAPGLCIVDPGPPSGRHASLYAAEPDRYPPRLWHALAADDVLGPGEHTMSTEALGALLSEGPWSRLLYLGHVAAPAADAPAQAALVFDAGGRDDVLTAGEWLAAPARWPAPDRVALLGCGSDDAAHLEIGGLSAAAVNAGATLVTTTRWVLPADQRDEDGYGTTDLAVAVHWAHRSHDPIGALRAWQLTRCDEWRVRPSLGSSPLLWGALCTYAAPPSPAGKPVMPQ